MRKRWVASLGVLLAGLALARCGDDAPGGLACPEGACEDAAAMGGAADAGGPNGEDASSSAGDASNESGSDAGGFDAASAEERDASSGGPDASTAADASVVGEDAGGPDASPPDAGGPDAGGGDAGAAPSPCVSGAGGSIAVRFAWSGSGSGSRAYPVYETNGLPDTSRWKVGAYGTSFSYTPTYEDVYLGPGGLALESGAFIDVELSTAGLTAIRAVSLAIYGRSYDTTASGSFEWQTFAGVGAAPANLVWKSVPYQWYAAEATAEFTAGDDSVLMRIRIGPVVLRVDRAAGRALL